jgi:chorismate dehydratase
MKDEVELVIDYPSNIASMLVNDEVDIGLVPVAIIPFLKEFHVISDYCIGCDGEVASVCLFSNVPLQEIDTILLDYQSRTSVALLKILLKEHWNISPELIDGTHNYEIKITGKTGGLVIGDRALSQRLRSKYIYDLGQGWKEMTGLPFVFAAWVSNKKLPVGFEGSFNKAIALGLNNFDIVKNENPFPDFDLKKYYDLYISFKLDERKKEGLELFLSMLR